jgi:hypothetical protein
VITKAYPFILAVKSAIATLRSAPAKVPLTVTFYPLVKAVALEIAVTTGVSSVLYVKRHFPTYLQTASSTILPIIANSKIGSSAVPVFVGTIIPAVLEAFAALSVIQIIYVVVAEIIVQ